METVPPFDRSQLSILQSSRKETGDIRKILELQRMVVQQNLHQMVSPLNAIQGYLELMDNASNANQKEKKKYYKQQIETGLEEMHKILQHIHELYETKDPGAQESGYVDDVVDLLQTTHHYLDVDLNWIIRAGVNKMDCWTVFLNMDLAEVGTHIIADVYLIRVVVHEFLQFISQIHATQSVGILLKSYSDETNVYMSAKLSESVGFDHWSTNEQLPLSQFHRWLDLAKSLKLKTETSDRTFTIMFPRA